MENITASTWTAQEEETIAKIMAGESLARIKAIQSMQRRKSVSKSLSRRLNLQDPFNSAVRCQDDRCHKCAAMADEVDEEMAAFLDIMLNGKQRSGNYFLVQRDPVTGLFPVSARMDGPTLESGDANGLVCVRRGKSRSMAGKAVVPTPEAITGKNVDGLMAFPTGMGLDAPSGKPIKALRGRPRLPEKDKRLAASERQARWRQKQARIQHAMLPAEARADLEAQL